MNKPLSAVEILTFTVPVMARRDKLLRLAQLVRTTQIHPLVMFSGLEYLPPHALDELTHPCSAFALAANDPILKDAGLKSATVGEALRFFELSKDDLHEFSCDCGGLINNEDMAGRIERLARR